MMTIMITTTNTTINDHEANNSGLLRIGAAARCYWHESGIYYGNY